MSEKVVLVTDYAWPNTAVLAELQTKAAENVAALLNGQRPTALVNPQVLDLPRWSHLKP